MPRCTPLAAALLAFLFAARLSYPQNPAPAPPMGWSEWDAFGLTITESDFRANALVLATLRPYGWQYALLDAGWYEQDPASHDKAQRIYVWDANGRLIPARNRFPSAANGAGFQPLAGWLHARGLKLGIHVMLGIPRQAVAANLPIVGSAFHASDAADTTQTCSWDDEFYVARDNAAGQAWYDSIARQYAAWGVDLIKLGCVSDHPFHPSEIRQMSAAIRKTSRPIVLSLSPGPVPSEYAAFAIQSAQMVRVSPEHWDLWTTPTGKTFPVGLRDDFDLIARWASTVQPGHWIDLDLLADGWLAPHPAWGEGRHSQLTPDEERSEFTLWTFARAPLIEGASLTRLDPLTRSLMTNRELIAINQQARETHPLTTVPSGFEHARVWEARLDASAHSRCYFAFFNLGDRPVTLHATWSDLGLSAGPHAAHSLWDNRTLAPSDSVNVVLPAHASAIIAVY
jgi:alpha-galactosidase